MYYARTEPRAGKRKAETVAAIVKRRKTGGSAEKLRNELFRLTRLVTETGGAVFHSHYKRHFNGVDIHDRYIYKSVSRHHHREWTAALVFWFIRSGMVNVWTVINMSFALDRHSFRDRLVDLLLGLDHRALSQYVYIAPDGQFLALRLKPERRFHKYNGTFKSLVKNLFCYRCEDMDQEVWVLPQFVFSILLI